MNGPISSLSAKVLRTEDLGSPAPSDDSARSPLVWALGGGARAARGIYLGLLLGALLWGLILLFVRVLRA